MSKTGLTDNSEGALSGLSGVISIDSDCLRRKSQAHTTKYNLLNAE